MNTFPSAFAPCKAKKSAPACTFRESQATWPISRVLAPADRVVSTPWNTSLSFFRSSKRPACTECFRWLSAWFVAASCICSSWLNPILILVPCSLEQLCNLWCRCPELHCDLCAALHLRSRRWRLIRSKTAANGNRVQPQSKTNLRDGAHCLSREVWHLNVAPFLHSYRHVRRLTQAHF